MYHANKIILLFFLLGTTNTLLTAKKTKQPTIPQVTVVMVLDQGAFSYFPKLAPFFKHGFKHLLDHGIVYENAHHAHGVPETTPGHHAISTGTLPKYHGATYNSWVNPDNFSSVKYECDTSPDAAILDPNHEAATKTPAATFQPGCSARHTMVDGLSDQFISMRNTHPNDNYHVWALSLKAHPVISCANRLGKAIWFDQKRGGFTSSKKYFDQLPTWVTKFNKKRGFASMTSLHWKTVYPLNHAAYNFPDSRNYDYAGYPESMATATTINCGTSCNAGEQPFERYVKTPQSAQALFDLAKKCIDHIADNDRLLLWISISNLDLCGHIYGPDSLECIDIMYHLDRQIGDFMDFVNQEYGADNSLFALTADHGICPFPELTNKRGITLARRIMAPELIAGMNKLLQEKFGLENIVRSFEPTFFVLDQVQIKALDQEKQIKIIDELKQYLRAQPGIKKVWTFHELMQLPFEEDQFEQFYKNQLYKGRAGDLIVMCEPYCLLTKYAKGTSHSDPYEYNTHVPLMLLQKGRVDKKHVKNSLIKDKVWVPQLPISLAHIMGIARPSASPYKVLPGIEA